AGRTHDHLDTIWHGDIGEWSRATHTLRAVDERLDGLFDGRDESFVVGREAEVAQHLACLHFLGEVEYRDLAAEVHVAEARLLEYIGRGGGAPIDRRTGHSGVEENAEGGHARVARPAERLPRHGPLDGTR